MFQTVLLCFLTIAQVSSFNSRSVNVAVVAALDIDPNEINRNSELFRAARKFLSGLRQADASKLEPSKVEVASEAPYELRDHHVLTDFLHYLGVALLKYQDEHLTFLARCLHKEIYESKTFQKTFNQPEYKSNAKEYIKSTLNTWSTDSAETLKQKIENTIKHEADDTPINDAMVSFNALYSVLDKKRLTKLLGQFENYPKNVEFLEKIVKDGIEVALTRKFESLDHQKALAASIIFKIEPYLQLTFKASSDNDVKKNSKAINNNIEKKVTESELELKEVDNYAKYQNKVKQGNDGSESELALKSNFDINVEGPTKEKKKYSENLLRQIVENWFSQ